MACAVLIVALAIRCIFLFAPGFANDQAQFIAWSEISRPGSTTVDGASHVCATSTANCSLADVYQLRSDGSGKRWCNYPPAYLYVLRVWADIYNWLAPAGVTLDTTVWEAVLRGHDSAATRLAVALYKVPAVVADALLGALLVVWVGRRVDRRWAAVVGLVYVCTPAVIHNSTVWGQVDAIPTLLVVGSLEMARRRRVPLMLALAVLAVLTKAQAGVMLPVWLVVALRWTGSDWRRWASAAGTALAVSFVVLLPFRDALAGVWDAYAGAATYYPFMHLNGFSAWFLANPMTTPHLDSVHTWYLRDDVPNLLGITARGWGMTGVLGVWVCATVVLWRRRADERSLFWAARLLPPAFFVLSTQMHERYLFPAIAVWAWSFVHTRRWWACWILLCACASVNVLWAWAGPDDAVWATWCGQTLHQRWLGLLPGVWCSLILIGVLVAALVKGIDLRVKSRRTRTPLGRGQNR